jgi:DNA-binding HxlR family transcriptional regulator
MSTPQLELLDQLGRHRWTVPLIAALAARNGGRFVELLHVLGLSRESLSRTLDGATATGWVMRNPGHGHPLRPEYVLTDKGKIVASLCMRIVQAESTIGLAPGDIGRWSRPIIRIIDSGEHRYSGIARNLPGSNPRALTQNLKSLVMNRLVMRTVVAQYPSVAEYHLSAAGAGLASAFAVQADAR